MLAKNVILILTKKLICLGENFSQNDRIMGIIDFSKELILITSYLTDRI